MRPRANRLRSVPSLSAVSSLQPQSMRAMRCNHETAWLGRRSSRNSARPLLCHQDSAPRSTTWATCCCGGSTARPMTPDPVALEIVEGTLASAEAEVEAAIERSARSPMIREARDFRAGIHDRHCRKLTGRSYSALVQPIVRDFPIESMQSGDVFFHNDVYGSEGGIGHLPDMCCTVPVFHDGEVVAFVQAFGHHDDIGGAVPGAVPRHGTPH